MIYLQSLVVVVVVVIGIVACDVTAALSANVRDPLSLSDRSPNTCSRDVLVEEEFTVSYHKPQQIVTTTFCLGNWPPVCEQKKTVYKLGYRTDTRTKLKKDIYCCPGYAQHGDR